MLFIDAIKRVDGQRLRAVAKPKRDAWYADGDGNMPAWVGIELMAQAIAAYVGYAKWRKGEPTRMGFLLGTRKYSVTIPVFPADTILDVVVDEVYREPSGLGAFDCFIELNGVRVAEATVKAFEPENPQQFLQTQ